MEQNIKIYRDEFIKAVRYILSSTFFTCKDKIYRYTFERVVFCSSIANFVFTFILNLTTNELVTIENKNENDKLCRLNFNYI